ncbi:hypothetical protein JVU11DRAFT_1651 [Chiua virens]|nr:hypothetical protein JVU11DRAFT_1651 [Chiua virens]
MHIFTPNHVSLVSACYPPSSVLLSAGPEYRPNAQELSRLTYYATNRPGKIHKLGAELEKHCKNECTKALAGNARARASLLITLAILRALAVECRRDISLLSPSLLSCLKITLNLISSDLEISARAASVLTAWCTYTNGHDIGVDAGMTQNYLVVLGLFAKLSTTEIKSVDYELRNRTRLVGLAAITGVVTSEALYFSSTQFKSQVSKIIRALLFHILHPDPKTLDECTFAIKDNTPSVYMAEFRTRPPDQRRAASIHVHVDGESGPSSADILTASLRAFSFLLQHSNAAQIGLLLQAAFETMDDQQLWTRADQCRWFSRKACEWTQYQYRYAVPSRLVERLLETQDSPLSTDQQRTLTKMLTTVFTSPIPLVNLSTSDIVSNLITMVLRTVSVNPDDQLLPLLVESISSLGTHVYYSDQIQDLASELITRLVTIEANGLPFLDRDDYNKRRSQAIRCLLAGLSGLIQAADALRKEDHENTSEPLILLNSRTSSPISPSPQRKRVSGEIWYETLNLLCDPDYAVRSDYAHTLVTYLRQELAKHGTSGSSTKRSRKSMEENSPIQTNINISLCGDHSTRSLHATHAYLFMLATTSTFGSPADHSPSPAHSLNGDLASVGVSSMTPSGDPSGPSIEVEVQASRPSSSRRSAGTITRSRKASNTQRLLECTPRKVSSASLASLSDHALILHVLTTIHEELPMRGLLTGVPMLLSLDAASQIKNESDLSARQRAHAVREVLARVWLVIGRVWECADLIKLAKNALASSQGSTIIPQVAAFSPGVLRPPAEQVMFPPVTEPQMVAEWSHVNAEEALSGQQKRPSTTPSNGLIHTDP